MKECMVNTETPHILPYTGIGGCLNINRETVCGLYLQVYLRHRIKQTLLPINMTKT